jgi:hypothetical protein
VAESFIDVCCKISHLVFEEQLLFLREKISKKTQDYPTKNIVNNEMNLMTYLNEGIGWITHNSVNKASHNGNDFCHG